MSWRNDSRRSNKEPGIVQMTINVAPVHSFATPIVTIARSTTMTQRVHGSVMKAAIAAGRSLANAWLFVHHQAGRICDTLAVWHSRAQSRRELAELDERFLKDIGTDHFQANQEVRKPFWRE